MYRTHTCGELNLSNEGQIVKLSGWVSKIRDKGTLIWIDLRDRYGITQLVIEESIAVPEIVKEARELSREHVIQAEGEVIERFSKNPNLPTGEIEIRISSLNVLNKSKLPPFTIEDISDGGDELRMKYRYLDIRRNPVRDNLILRNKMAIETRKFLNCQGFIEIETPVLIKSTPEGARDFVVPSRMNPGEFYALPQSPQTFKQLLMVAGMDKYFQLVKCFRDEDLRADRQPEFTQIDCEMSFVEREDILVMFEKMAVHLFKAVLDIDIQAFPRLSYPDAMKYYGTDKPDIRFEMKFTELNEIVKNKGFRVFDEAELVAGINVPGCSNYTRKQLDELTEFVRKPQLGASGLVYLKIEPDGNLKSSVDKFYNTDELKKWQIEMNASPGDLILILAGKTDRTRKALSELRLEMAERLGFRKKDVFAPLWVTDFPLLEWNGEAGRFYAMHHPFTSPVIEDIQLIGTRPAAVRANAYDLVINGIEIGGGSIRISDRDLQNKMFKALGFSEEEAIEQFGFLLNAFEYGAPPHGGIAFGFDRWCALFGGSDSIRDFIAFPKNNSGRDTMIDTPAKIHPDQLSELHINISE